MKPFSAFAAPGRWFRGNCHCHTTLSDGRSSPPDTVAAYARRRYDFLVLTDHWKTQPDIAALQRPGLLVINGIELHPPTACRWGQQHHIVGIGVEKTPDQKSLERGNVARTIRWVERQGGIPLYGHPYWSGHESFHMMEGRAAFGVEAYNSTCEAVRGLGDSSVHLDHMLSRGLRWRIFAVDDTHRVERDAFGGWINVKAERLTRDAILDAIRRGFFYASTGPALRAVRIERRRICIECSPVRRIVLHGEGPAGRVIFAERRGLTRAEFRLADVSPCTKYLRVECTDNHSRKAWSQPIFRVGKTNAWRDA